MHLVALLCDEDYATLFVFDSKFAYHFKLKFESTHNKIKANQNKIKKKELE